MRCNEGNWIIRNADGKFYTYKRDLFKKLYEHDQVGKNYIRRLWLEQIRESALDYANKSSDDTIADKWVELSKQAAELFNLTENRNIS